MPIPDFADQLLAEEGAGILRWMVEGAIELLNDLQERGNFILTEVQTARINRLMDQSDSTRRFVEEGVVKSRGWNVTVSELMTAYYEFCEDRGWHPMSTSEVSTQLPRHMLEVHKAARRNDIDRVDKRQLRLPPVGHPDAGRGEYGADESRTARPGKTKSRPN